MQEAHKIKLFTKLEKELRASLTKNALEFRNLSFSLLDWVPILENYLTPTVYANLLIQVGIKFQQASVLETDRVVKHADEQLALKMYIIAFKLTEKAAPDITLYVTGLIVSLIAQFECDNELTFEALREFQKNIYL